jgi:hypothetical protein
VWEQGCRGGEKTNIWCTKDCYYQVTQHGKRAGVYTHWFVMSIDVVNYQWTW